MSVLVDTSVWVDYLRGDTRAEPVDDLIQQGLVVTNDLVLAELVPPLRLRRQRRLIALLETVERLPLAIDWPGIVEMQVACLRRGVNRVGIPDLILAQNAAQHHCPIYSHDKHFALIDEAIPLDLYHR